MKEANYTVEVCAAAADIERASEIITGADPSRLDEFAGHLASAIGRLKSIKTAPKELRPQMDELGGRLRTLNALFANADAFYRGWAALAGVTENDFARPTISIQG